MTPVPDPWSVFFRYGYYHRREWHNMCYGASSLFNITTWR